MDELIGSVKGGGEIVAVVIAIAALISAFVPDNKMPAWLAKILNVVALNVGKAKNDPGAQ